MPSPSADPLRDRAQRLGLYGLLARWDEFRDEPWIPRLLECEDEERSRRSLERRIRNAKIGRFKPMCDFDWKWPESIDREGVEDLFQFRFVPEHANVVLVGPNGVGKTMIAQNLAHQVLSKGYTARFITASDLLNDLAAQETSSAFKRHVRRYVQPDVLAIDEVGYLSYDNRHADLLFEVVTRRYQEKSTIISTNKVFGDWGEVFPNAGCVVTLVDRLIHHAEIISIKGESYRLKEAKERESRRKQARRKKRGTKKTHEPSEKTEAPSSDFNG
jgi:DNA replication protein DnaC